MGEVLAERRNSNGSEAISCKKSCTKIMQSDECIVWLGGFLCRGIHDLTHSEHDLLVPVLRRLVCPEMVYFSNNKVQWLAIWGPTSAPKWSRSSLILKRTWKINLRRTRVLDTWSPITLALFSSEWARSTPLSSFFLDKLWLLIR